MKYERERELDSRCQVFKKKKTEREREEKPGGGLLVFVLVALSIELWRDIKSQSWYWNYIMT
jgi:hypothetical protein